MACGHHAGMASGHDGEWPEAMMGNDPRAMASMGLQGTVAVDILPGLAYPAAIARRPSGFRAF